MPAPPMPAPVLDQPPASPDSVAATQPTQDMTMKSLNPQPQAEGGAGQMQVVEITLKTGQAIGQGLDILGQIHPAFAPLGQQMQAMLREGLRSVLDQGLGSSEPAAPPQQPTAPMSGQLAGGSPAPGAAGGVPGRGF